MRLIKKVVGFKGDIVFDKTKPDGVHKKVLNIEKINGLGWSSKTSLEVGLRKYYKWYIENFNNIEDRRLNEKVALITGVTGQDGSYLAEFLLKKGYFVHGIKRRSSSFNTGRIDHLYEDPLEKKTNFFLHYGDMTDATNLIRLIQKIKPNEIYNSLASHVWFSFETAEYTANADALSTLRILEAIRILGLEKKIKFYQASTSELYGNVKAKLQMKKHSAQESIWCSKTLCLLDNGKLS